MNPKISLFKTRSVSAALILLLSLVLIGESYAVPARLAALLQAIRSEQLPTLKKLLQAGAPVNSADSSGKTPLMVAVDCCETKSKTANLPAARLLLEHGANPNAQNVIKYTPLFYAIESESAPAVRLLIEHGAKVNMEAPYGKTPLNRAIERGEITIPQILLEHGAQARGLHNDNAPLIAAAGRGNVAVARLLVARGASVKMSSGGTTPLHVAAHGNETAMVNFLIEKGAVVNARDDTGETPLLSAAMFGGYDTVDALLKAGANPNLPDREGATPLLYATIGFSPQSLKIVGALLEKGANPNLAPPLSGGPLSSAARSGDVEVVQLLLRKGADPRNGGEETPLHSVLEQGNHLHAQMALFGYGGTMTAAEKQKIQREAESRDLAIVRALLEKGVEVSSGLNRLLLVDAAQTGNAAIVQLMLQKGASPNVSDAELPIPPQLQKQLEEMKRSDPKAAQDIKQHPESYGLPTGNTPLLVAAQGGYPEVVTALLDAGAEPDRADRQGQTPLLALAGAGRAKIARELPMMREAVLHRADEGNPKPVSRDVSPSERAATGQWADAGDVAIVRSLVAKGAHVDARDAYGRTALMLAARLGRPAVVRALLENGADINAVDDKGQSALMQTIVAGRRQNAPQLFSGELENLMQMDARHAPFQDAAQKQRATTVQLAAKKQHAAVYKEAVADDLAMLQLLKERGANLTLKDKSGATALQLAQKWHYEAAEKFLLPNPE